MILRVYALWNRSRTILAILLSIYVPQIIVSIVWECISDRTLSGMLRVLLIIDSFTRSRFSPVTIVQVPESNYCNYSSSPTPSVTYRAIPRFVLGVTLLILGFVPTLRQSVEMYKLSKRWQTNRPMELLVKEGAVYFVVYVSIIIIPMCHFHMSIIYPFSLPSSS